ncbi:hypothetical protein [Planomicrobium sp. CPCC 101079]|uniref:hypothetical protein n=1 Tax=Planomicrobium sp. CPCC 101079 TaxID=2599618 RepID=UPI0011B5FFB7|nr:hypothetical protein [Planomicrobium sp. CPCC 101079]TWT09231.1 hypothetical protein FQV28_06245 [Planomicrobium sp. CPCC 101079]
MERLHEKFIHSIHTKRFTLNEINEYLTMFLKAKPVNIDKFEELKEDVCVNFDNIVFCYSITDEEAKNNLLTAAEKQEMQKMKKLISSQSSLSAKDKKIALQQVEMLNIILESSDGKYVDNFTLQGGSEKLLDEMIFLKGIDPEKCILGNEEYEMYLEVVHKKSLFNQINKMELIKVILNGKFKSS